MSIRNPRIQDDEKDLLFQMGYIPEFVRKKCEMELNETPERKKRCIQQLRKALASNKVTEDISFHEDLLVQYLRHSKYNVTKALDQLRNLIVLRRKEFKLFECVHEKYFITKPSTKFVVVLPKRSPDGCTLVLSRLGVWDPNELSFDDFKRIVLMTFLQLLRDPMTQINGFKIIHDFAGTRTQHLKYCTPQNLYLFYYISLYCIPGRYKEIHFLNETPVLRVLWSIIRNFISEKIRSRVFFHSDSNGILNYFPKSVLPAKYGGELVDACTSNFVQTANREQKKNTAAGQPNIF